ncbi:MAG: arylesterase [Acidobacteriota bacterium]|nr:arylesterase [Acidobacteriota bacterium]
MFRSGRRRAWFAAAVVVAALAGCERSQPDLPRLPADGVIVAFGDSVTFGIGAPRDASYPAVLADLTGRTVVNAGVPGEISAEGSLRLPGVIDEHRPDLIILCEGGNDLLRDLAVETLDSNLRAMVRTARDRGIPVVLIGVPEPGLVLSSAGLYEEVAGDHGLVYEGEILADILSRGSLKSDMIHPNADGYRLLAEAIHELLTSTGAI